MHRHNLYLDILIMATIVMGMVLRSLGHRWMSRALAGVAILILLATLLLPK
jgi:hypothetical protein